MTEGQTVTSVVARCTDPHVICETRDVVSHFTDKAYVPYDLNGRRCVAKTGAGIHRGRL